MLIPMACLYFIPLVESLSLSLSFFVFIPYTAILPLQFMDSARIDVYKYESLFFDIHLTFSLLILWLQLPLTYFSFLYTKAKSLNFLKGNSCKFLSQACRVIYLLAFFSSRVKMQKLHAKFKRTIYTKKKVNILII